MALTNPHMSENGGKDEAVVVWMARSTFALKGEGGWRQRADPRRRRRRTEE